MVYKGHTQYLAFTICSQFSTDKSIYGSQASPGFVFSRIYERVMWHMCDMWTHVIHVDVCDTCLESIMATEKEFFILY